VPAAEAAEATLLEQITRIFPPEAHDEVVAKLQRPNEKIVSTPNPKLSELLSQYYEARSRTIAERSRHLSVRAAYNRPRIPVVIALSALQPGEKAVVIRQRLNSPFDVILLSPDAGVDALAGGFAALNKSRSIHGDEFENAQRIAIQDVHLTKADPKYVGRLQQLINSAHAAPERNIEGVGVMRTIDSRSETLVAK
jgi:hypothetical protein